MSLRVAVAGATGYTGVELVRLLVRHPRVELGSVTTQSYGGEDLAQVYPHLQGYINSTCEQHEDLERIVAANDAILVALPHGHAAPVVQAALAQDKPVIDLGADFRLDNAATYTQWYGKPAGLPELLPQVVYGLPEVNRARIKQARVVANPGCYPTSIMLGLAPALQAGLIRLDSLVINSLSGVSGAGRGLALTSHFVEANENVNPYSVGNHRHLPEIEQELSKLAGRELRVSFTPHLIPVSRGILTTITAQLADNRNTAEVADLYRQYYQDEPFIQLLPSGVWPHTGWVKGSNNCQIGLQVDDRVGRLVVVTAIDNLVKGAAGQAIQNLNLVQNWPETMGLEQVALWP